MVQWVKDLAQLCSVASSIPGLDQWVKDLGLDLISGPGTSLCCSCSQKRKKKKKSLLILLNIFQSFFPTNTHFFLTHMRKIRAV